MKERVQKFLDDLIDFYCITCRNPESITELKLIGDLGWKVEVIFSNGLKGDFAINRYDTFDEVARKFFNYLITEKLQREMYEEDGKYED